MLIQTKLTPRWIKYCLCYCIALNMLIIRELGSHLAPALSRSGIYLLVHGVETSLIA
jgi:hypothetical protein